MAGQRTALQIMDLVFTFCLLNGVFCMNLSSHLSRTLLVAAVALSAQAALAQQQLVPAQSEVQFTARQMGVPLDGHFKKFNAQVAFDPAKLATSKIAFTVDTGSATLGSRETDAELPKPTCWPGSGSARREHHGILQSFQRPYSGY